MCAACVCPSPPPITEGSEYEEACGRGEVLSLVGVAPAVLLDRQPGIPSDAARLDIICNNGTCTVTTTTQTTVPQGSLAGPIATGQPTQLAEVIQAEKTYNPVALPTLAQDIDALWATKGEAIARCFKLPAKPQAATMPTYASTILGRIRRRAFLLRERGRRSAWYLRAAAKLAWDLPTFCVVAPIAIVTGFISTGKLMLLAPFQSMHLTQPKGLVQAIIYTNDGHDFAWLKETDLDTHVRRRKAFGLETHLFTHVVMASLERTLDGRYIAFDPNPTPTDATPDNHYMELEAPQESMAFLRKSTKTPWLKAFQWGAVLLALGIVTGGFVLVILTMLDPNAIPAPVLNAEGIIPTVLPKP